LRTANDTIRAWAVTQPEVRFVDISAVMLDAQGRPRPELFREDSLQKVTELKDGRSD
jgi:hypothetical protein